MKYILFNCGATFHLAMYEDLGNNPNVIWCKKIQPSWLCRLRDLHTSIRGNRVFSLPFQEIWNDTFFDNTKLAENEKAIFIFEEGNKQAYSPIYLRYVKERYPIAKLVFSFLNPSNSIGGKYLEFVERNYDMIVTFDKADSLKFGWYYYNGIYSKREIPNASAPASDVLFIGQNKGRLDFAKKIYKYLSDSGVSCCFYITGVDESKVEHSTGIFYNQYLDYETVLNYVKNTKCILEILQEGQSGSTLRVMESLVYGKKLITNNRGIVSERYYKSDQMKIIGLPEDIDIDFILDGKSYIYDGGLSPIHFLKFIYDNLQLTEAIR